jgi:hypothetical protein
MNYSKQFVLAPRKCFCAVFERSTTEFISHKTFIMRFSKQLIYYGIKNLWIDKWTDEKLGLYFYVVIFATSEFTLRFLFSLSEYLRQRRKPVYLIAWFYFLDSTLKLWVAEMWCAVCRWSSPSSFLLPSYYSIHVLSSSSSSSSRI